eukprot:31541_1
MVMELLCNDRALVMKWLFIGMVLVLYGLDGFRVLIHAFEHYAHDEKYDIQVGHERVEHNRIRSKLVGYKRIGYTRGGHIKRVGYQQVGDKRVAHERVGHEKKSGGQQVVKIKWVNEKKRRKKSGNYIDCKFLLVFN